MVEWSLADAGRRFRAEDTLGKLSLGEEHDTLFFDLACVAFGDESADRLMYDRLKERGLRRAASDKG